MFVHASLLGQQRFLFSQYLQLFLEALLGEKIDVYSTLDGRQLVPYQAAVLRQQWLRIRTVFNDAFSLQKTAYRRANGGTTAPNVHEDVKARFLPHHTPLASVERCCLPQEPPQHKVVVRRTFLEVETETAAGAALEKLWVLFVFTCVPTRWAPTRYKWSYNPYKWPSEWVTGVITPLRGVMGPYF